MMIAMTVVRMVQVPVDEIVDVIAVRNRLVPAARAVPMTGGVTGAVVAARRAFDRIGGADAENVFVVVILVRAVQVAVVQVVDVTIMENGRVAAAGTVLMVVGRVGGVGHDLDGFLSFGGKSSGERTVLTGVGQCIKDKVGDVLVG